MKAEYSDTVAKRLDAFLSHPTKRVLLLKGKWGVGKTFYWTNTYLPTRLNKVSHIKEHLYAYVSLFGVDSADNLEQLIIASSVKVGDKESLDFIKTGVRKAVPLVKLIPGLKDYEGLMNRIGHMIIRNTLICIDDIERKAKSLSLVSVMGLISVLCENNNCRFVIIMNDEHLEEDDASDFNKYREKVIDETLTYAPDIADNTRLIFGKDLMVQQYIDVFMRIGINNIRVMRQSAWAVEHFLPQLKSLEPALAQQFREHIVLLTAFFHVPSLGIDVDKLPRESTMEYYFQKSEDKDPEHKKLMDKARQYRYDIQEYDPIIVDYLKYGACDEMALRSQLEEANTREQKCQISAKYKEMWVPYNRSFKASKATVANSFRAFLDKHAADLSFSQLWGIISLTDALGLKAKRSVWLDAWIAPRVQTSSMKRLREFSKHCRSRKLQSEIKRREKFLKRKVSIIKIIIRIVDNDSWNNEDVVKLGSFSVDDIRRELLQHDEENFLSAIHGFCKMWRGARPDENEIEKKIESALLSIANINMLNMLRVRMIIPWAFPDESVDEAILRPHELDAEE